MTSTELIERLNDTGYNNWHDEVDKAIGEIGLPATNKTMYAGARTADEIAQRYALIAHYMESRADGMVHQDALAKAKHRLVKIRRAMGYSYPEEV